MQATGYTLDTPKMNAPTAASILHRPMVLRAPRASSIMPTGIWASMYG